MVKRGTRIIDSDIDLVIIMYVCVWLCIYNQYIGVGIMHTCIVGFIGGVRVRVYKGTPRAGSKMSPVIQNGGGDRRTSLVAPILPAQRWSQPSRHHRVVHTEPNP